MNKLSSIGLVVNLTAAAFLVVAGIITNKPLLYGYALFALLLAMLSAILGRKNSKK